MLVRPESNSRPRASQPEAQPTEATVRSNNDNLTFRILQHTFSKASVIFNMHISPGVVCGILPVPRQFKTVIEISSLVTEPSGYSLCRRIGDHNFCI